MHQNAGFRKLLPRRIEYLLSKEYKCAGYDSQSKLRYTINILFSIVHPNVYSEPYATGVGENVLSVFPGVSSPYPTLISATFLGLKCLGTGPIWFLVINSHKLLQRFLPLYWCGPFRYSSSYFHAILKAQEIFCQANTELST